MGLPLENIELLQLTQWIKLQYPKVIFACDLIGMKLPIQAAVRVSKMRTDKYPDLFIAYPNKHYKGLFIEFKATGIKIYNKHLDYSNEHITKQAFVLSELNRLGYHANFACGFLEGKKLIEKYMNDEL